MVSRFFFWFYFIIIPPLQQREMEIQTLDLLSKKKKKNAMQLS